MSTVSVSATLEANNVPPRVRLDVVDVGNSPSIFATTVTRLNPDGNIVVVRTNDGNPLPLQTSGSNRTGLLYDYESPFQQQVTYSTLESPGTLSAPVTVPEGRVWLIHPGIPALSIPIGLLPGSLTDETRSVRQGVFYPMGRSSPIVVTDGGRKSASSSLTVVTETLAELAAVQAILADASVLLLNLPAQMNLGMDSSYVAIQDVQVSRFSDGVIDSFRAIKLPFVVVDMPAGGSQSERTYVDLFDFASYAVLQNSYSSYAAVLAGP